MKERLADKRARAQKLIERLDAAMPEAKIELDFTTPLELLVAVVLSAQTTDKRVNLVTPKLFQDFPSAQAYARASPTDLEPYLKTVGLFRNKSKALVKLGQALVERHQGVVPAARAALAALPGVGNKTAGVVTIHLKGGDLAFPVDTHILRLSKRMGLTHHDEPDDVEAALSALLPSDVWFKAHQLIIWHGRRVCLARSPACHRCVVADLCPKRGVK